MSSLWRRIGTGKSHSKSASDENATQDKLVLLGNSAKRFDLEDMLRASAQILGRGTFGTTYKADLGDFTTVVVKRLKPVLPLRGYYYRKDEISLLYIYMPLGSLSGQLHRCREGEGSPLSWEARLSIALGAARAIEDLHAHRRPYIHHGNIKSSNVLLTPSYEASPP